MDAPLPLLLADINALTFNMFRVLHFLEFAIWGAWFVVLGSFLNARGFSRRQIGLIYGTVPVGAIISPMFIGAIADQYFNTENVIAVSHLIGGVLLLVMSRVHSPRLFYWVTLLYALAFAPTLSLVNSIVFAHVPDAEAHFPLIRVFGTIGWIVAGLSHIVLLPKNQPVNERPIVLAAVLSIVLGVFSFYCLPDTPPGFVATPAEETTTTEAAGAIDVAVAESEAEAEAPVEDEATLSESISGLAKSIGELIQTLPVFLIVSLISAMAMAFYFAFGALFVEKQGNVKAHNVGPIMTIGQWIEIFFMFTLPWFLKTLGMDIVLALGVSAWALRFGLFAIGRPLALIVVGVALHGICFDFFFAAGFIHIDKAAPDTIRNSAQTLYGVLVYGLGMYLGSMAAGWLNQSCTTERAPAEGEAEIEPVTNWRKFWGISAAVMTVTLIVFAISLAMK